MLMCRRCCLTRRDAALHHRQRRDVLFSSSTSLLLAGNVMDPSSIMLIAAPILFPVAMKLGIDRVTSPLFFALARTQQASVPPPPRSVCV